MSSLGQLLREASQVLGVDVDATRSEIQYAFYRLMCTHHPDKNPDDPLAAGRAALIIEARDVLTGKATRAVLLKDRKLMAEVLNQPVQEADVLTYEQWQKQQFFDADQGSIWPV